MTPTLIEKLEQAEGPSREFDAELAVKFEVSPVGLKHMKGLQIFSDPCCPHLIEVRLANNDLLGGYAAPPLTSSLDAAVALVERVLPRHRWVIANRTGPQVGGSASVYSDDSLKSAEASTPALALCIALLKALEARKESE